MQSVCLSSVDHLSVSAEIARRRIDVGDCVDHQRHGLVYKSN